MDWCMAFSMEGGGLIRVWPDGCQWAGHWAASGACERWEPAGLWDRVCRLYLDRSEFPGLVGLFSCWRGAHCGLLDVVCIPSILFDDKFGMP